MSSGRTIVGMLPAIGVSLLPSVGCPACLPAAASVLGAAGLTFLTEPPYALWFNLGALVFAVAVLFWNRDKVGYLPLWTAGLGATAVIIGKFAYPNTVMSWTGVALLLIASIWSTRRKSGYCPQCTTDVKNSRED